MENLKGAKPVGKASGLSIQPDVLPVKVEFLLPDGFALFYFDKHGTMTYNCKHKWFRK